MADANTADIAAVVAITAVAVVTSSRNIASTTRSGATIISLREAV
jgi:hypothetical protein